MQIFKFSFNAMACSCEIVIGYDESTQLQDNAKCNAKYNAQNSAQLAIAEVKRIEAKYSRYRAESVIGVINQAAGKTPIHCDAETWTLLEYADTLYRSSGGLFDITAGVLRRAWNFSQATLPTEQRLAELCRLIDWSVLERHDQQIYLPREGMELDFGGFGKEYAADRAAVILQAQHVRFGYVNLGGDIRVLGPKPDQQAWQIGIQDPRNANNIIATIPIERGGLATSGDYQRYFELDGRRYCHIVHPRTGWPVDHWRSITVIAALTTMAGSCTTIAMLKQEKCLEFLQQAGVNYLAIDRDGQLYKNH
ncbi:FAD:protein FMN transferase [Undibacterium flavidum]|uniref:FAD:protein FMN transferase n=1 Tax=Undibacterium flavidum TaxID=2762297 RepID=A0ABR6YE80_9BURK|nr:FAD:protein FMN transferase [Undibacterium flavidum]MBC3874819.1 FAD:protein FMN transferase [Undibacterium flavidum]